MDINGILGVLPHRFPFLLLDRILRLDFEKGNVVAVKHVTGNEPFFAGMPVPVVPLCLELEMAAQAACALALKMPGNENKLGYFMSIDQGTWHAPVVPGDQLLIDMTIAGRGRFGTGEGKLYVGETPVTEMALKFALVDREPGKA
ncbi:MAG: hypothetical protein A2350_01455 [Candidatus Raymondbacteria bacterium RifOxyB12_full_50_8]|nr:MAG: hypothetical protein A2350_01455 [Candidatus Raymondbacteria bacterium RifOxyB12_full_50_8]